MTKFKMKPVEIEAFLWTGENIQDALVFMSPIEELPNPLGMVGSGVGFVPPLGHLDVPTVNGILTANAGDWIVKYGPGDFHPFKPHLFVARYEPIEQSNLVDHARRELAMIGEDEWATEGIVRIVQEFASMGHSGGSASIVIPMINDLLQFKNLSALTDDPEEWIQHGEDVWGAAGGVWQNKRNPEAFSHDNGKTYYLLSEGGNDKHPEPLHHTKPAGEKEEIVNIEPGKET